MRKTLDREAAVAQREKAAVQREKVAIERELVMEERAKAVGVLPAAHRGVYPRW
jgi:hypothetical protein